MAVAFTARVVMVCSVFVTLTCATEDYDCKTSPCFITGPVLISPEVSELTVTCTCDVDFNETLVPETWRNASRVNIKGMFARDVYFSFYDGCFSKFANLKELATDQIYIKTLAKGAFRGLDNLRVLDLSNCVNLDYSEFINAFETNETLPKLEKLVLHNAGTIKPGKYVIDDTFCTILSSKPLKHIDVSDMFLESYDVQNCGNYFKDLEVLNISGIGVANKNNGHLVIDPPRSLRVIDSSRMLKDQSNNIGPFCVAPVYAGLDINKTIAEVAIFPYLETLYFDNICGGMNEQKTIQGTITLSGNNSLKEMYLRRNNFNCDGCHSLERMDLSHNGMEFLNAYAFASVKHLRSFNLAENYLGKMAKTKTDMFGQMFNTYLELESLSLAKNSIESMPADLFIYNTHLRRLDLSDNLLTEIPFNGRGLTSLEELYVNGNQFETLKTTTLETLTSLPDTLKFRMSGNNFKCFNCLHYETIKWLKENKERILDFSNITCADESGIKKAISVNIEHDLQYICNRHVTIILTAALISFCLLICLMVLFYIVRRQRLRRKLARRKNTVYKLQRGELDFAAFILYSSRDAEFVIYNIYPNLLQNLRHVVDMDKNLICIGDRDFRAGQTILDEVIRCTKSSAAIIVILSDSFCNSEYCLHEFDVAFRLGKPIILMVKGEVDLTRAPSSIKDLFQTYVRVLWRQDGHGEYRLTTSWDNVCNAILEAA